MVITENFVCFYNPRFSSPLSTSLPLWMDRPGCIGNPWDLQCLSSCQRCPTTPFQSCPSPQGVANVSCGKCEI